MKLFQQHEFKGEYQVFYPNLDITPDVQGVISTAFKKMFGDKTKVFFTDESEASLLESVDSIQTVTATIPSNPTNDPDALISPNLLQLSPEMKEKLENIKKQRQNRKTDSDLVIQSMGIDPNDPSLKAPSIKDLAGMIQQ